MKPHFRISFHHREWRWMPGPVGKKELYRGKREEFNIKVYQQHLAVISLDWSHHPPELCYEQNCVLHCWKEPSHGEWWVLCCTVVIVSVLCHWGKKIYHFYGLMLHFYAIFVTSRHDTLENEWHAEETCSSYRSRLGSFGFWEQHAKARILNMSVKALPSAGLVMKTERPTRKTKKETPRHTAGMMYPSSKLMFCWM